jgi:hypothetical protein
METVNHPAHYNQHPSGIECITIVQDAPFNIGNAIKYLWRATWGSKPGTDRLEDLRKAIWYIQAEIERLTKNSQVVEGQVTNDSDRKAYVLLSEDDYYYALCKLYVYGKLGKEEKAKKIIFDLTSQYPDLP